MSGMTTRISMQQAANMVVAANAQRRQLLGSRRVAGSILKSVQLVDTSDIVNQKNDQINPFNLPKGLIHIKNNLYRLPSTLSSLASKNPFIARITELGQLVWATEKPIQAEHIVDIVKFSEATKRSVHVNTGVNESPKTPVKKDSDEEKVIKNTATNVSLKLVMPGDTALQPPNCDRIDACFNDKTPLIGNIEGFLSHLAELVLKESLQHMPEIKSHVTFRIENLNIYIQDNVLLGYVKGDVNILGRRVDQTVRVRVGFGQRVGVAVSEALESTVNMAGKVAAEGAKAGIATAKLPLGVVVKLFKSLGKIRLRNKMPVSL